MSFNLTVTEEEIKETLNQLNKNIYPNSASLDELTFYVFNYADTVDDNLGIVDITDIDRRKVRLCIAELRKRGFLIIAKRGYSLAGDDPEQVIHFINGLYSRANKLTKEADVMFHEFKKKYGDKASAKIEAHPGQTWLDVTGIEPQPIKVYIPEPPFRKSIDARGNEIALQFEADA
jgi:hypothetical protein